ncbi:hypothetical protein MPTK2_8g15000 [Marchantia polymorpha subsp. ruderalis]
MERRAFTSSPLHAAILNSELFLQATALFIQNRQMTLHSAKKMKMKMNETMFIIISTLCVSVWQLSSVQASAAAPAATAAQTVQPLLCAQRVAVWNDESNDSLNIECSPTDNPSGPHVAASLTHPGGNFFFNPLMHDAEADRWTCIVGLAHAPGCLKFTAWADEQHQSSLVAPCHFCAYKVSTLGLWIDANSCHWSELPDWHLLQVPMGHNCSF